MDAGQARSINTPAAQRDRSSLEMIAARSSNNAETSDVVRSRLASLLTRLRGSTPQPVPPSTGPATTQPIIPDLENSMERIRNNLDAAHEALAELERLI